MILDTVGGCWFSVFGANSKKTIGFHAKFEKNLKTFFHLTKRQRIVGFIVFSLRVGFTVFGRGDCDGDGVVRQAPRPTVCVGMDDAK